MKGSGGFGLREAGGAGGCAGPEVYKIHSTWQVPGPQEYAEEQPFRLLLVALGCLLGSRHYVFGSQRVHLDCQSGIRAQNPYMVWFL